MKFIKDAETYAESVIGNELVLMNVETGTFHAFRGVALAVWRLLDSEADPVAITSVIAERFEVDAATCDQEVDSFLRELQRARFLVGLPGTPWDHP